MSTQEYKYAEIAGYRLELIDEFTTRILAPNGLAWRIPRTDDKDGFGSFLCDFVQAMIDHQGGITKT
jgi:hypothetical protein